MFEMKFSIETDIMCAYDFLKIYSDNSTFLHGKYLKKVWKVYLFNKFFGKQIKIYIVNQNSEIFIHTKRLNWITVTNEKTCCFHQFL